MPAALRPGSGESRNYEGKSECHIQPDWLLIYRVEETSNSVVFYRTGTYSDLF
ncbi:MAG: type II toxin-antitoxin system YafQ family toxin [Treponema sp.]|nr:type II toxin-antitoxin system YafQ family toxin [Treponema sp.]